MKATYQRNNLHLQESFISSKDSPEKLIWVNGTTDMRFDLAKNKFKDIAGGYAQLSPFSPMYLTSNIKYALSYINSHVSKDFGIKDNKTRAHGVMAQQHGIVVFVQLKEGVHLFDFTDIDDYQHVFSKDASQIYEIFKEAEPYFSFNTAVINKHMKYVPDEFSIAKELSLWRRHKHAFPKTDADWKKWTFVTLFKQADNNTFNFKISEDDYMQFYESRQEWLKDSIVKLSNAGRKQTWVNGHLVKIFSSTLSSSQLAKINAYLSLLDQCVSVREWIFNDTGVLPANMRNQILSMNNTQMRAESGGYVDLLQACLFFMIHMSSDFKGFWCPEFIGARAKDTVASHGFSPAIALFDEDAIENVKTFSMNDVMAALHDAQYQTGTIDECNATLLMLKDQSQRIVDAREEHKKKIAAGFSRVNKTFIDNVMQAVSWDYLDRDDYREIAKAAEKWCKDNEGTYVMLAPKDVAKTAAANVSHNKLHANASSYSRRDNRKQRSTSSLGSIGDIWK